MEIINIKVRGMWGAAYPQPIGRYEASEPEVVTCLFAFIAKYHAEMSRNDFTAWQKECMLKDFLKVQFGEPQYIRHRADEQSIVLDVYKPMCVEVM